MLEREGRKPILERDYTRVSRASLSIGETFFFRDSEKGEALDFLFSGKPNLKVLRGTHLLSLNPSLSSCFPANPVGKGTNQGLTNKPWEDSSTLGTLGWKPRHALYTCRDISHMSCVLLLPI
ncbi:uncharacterized protein G2W53_040692 [Senna tora]|uniref:Uncharacterized protein n=1 Tax=Senna tora TaxID=362788 RepID=A0A834SEH8_9FABA|nr:uncharacterized protein G2W53_040692 [Senna tora]